MLSATLRACLTASVSGFAVNACRPLQPGYACLRTLRHAIASHAPLWRRPAAPIPRQQARLFVKTCRTISLGA
eukprot:5418803-Pleurochrysis_carterae.AAC.2